MNPTAPVLTADQLNAIAKGSGYTGGTFSSVGLTTPPSAIPVSSTSSTALPFVNPNANFFSQPPAQSVQTPQQTLTPTEQIIQDSIKSLQDLNNQEVGKSAFTAQQNETLGVNSAQQTINDLTMKVNQLANDAKAIPLQVQNDFTGRGATVGGVEPIQTAALRNNAIEALTTNSLLQSAQGNLVTAQANVDRAVQAKYGPIEEKLSALTKNLQLIINSPQYSLEQKNQAIAQQNSINAQQAQLDQQKQTYQAVQTIAVQAAANINKFKPTAQYQTAAQALTAIQNAKSPVEAQQIASQAFPAPITDNGFTLSPGQKRYDAYGNLIASAPDSSGVINVTSGDNSTKPYYNAFNSVVIGLPQAAQKIAQNTFAQYMASGDLQSARDYLVRIATQNLPAADQTQALGRAQATSALKDIQSLLDQAKEKGASTNLLSGSLVDVAQKLGTSTNTDLSYISARIQQQLQVYRRSMTGVAFSPQESAEYAKIFPDITNVESLNSAKIKALTDAFESNNRASLSFLLGDSNYNSIFGTPSAPTLPSDVTQPNALPLDDAYNLFLQMTGGSSSQTTVAPTSTVQAPSTQSSIIPYSYTAPDLSSLFKF